MDGEINVKNGTERHAAGRRPVDRATRTRRALHWRSVVLSLAVLAAGAVVPGFAGPAQAQKVVQLAAAKRTAAIAVAIGKSEDIRTDASFVDIAVGDSDIADVNPLTDRSLSILGKKIGTTRVSVYAEGKKLTGIFDVEVSYDTTQLAAELARRFPHAKLRVSSVNGRMMLSGSVPDGTVLDRALTLARQFGPDVINSIAVEQAQQVMLEVRFVEASRQAGRELGVQWNMFGKRALANIGSQTPGALLPVTPSGTSPFKNPGVDSGGVNNDSILRSPIVAAGVLGTATAPFGFLLGNLLSGSTSLDVIVNALEERGLARRLAEPNLVALSGDTASFLAGGESPTPVPGQYGAIPIDYKRYGVSLAFTPTVLNDGLINMKIEPEVSQIDPSHTVSVGNGIVVPALTVRRANTTVELRDGQSFVLAGLLHNEGSTIQQQLPWLGDVPVLGALFSSKSYQRNETDLVIIVTPRIVNPSRAGDVVRTPLDNTLPGNDVDFFLNGKAELARGPAQRGETAALRAYTGHMLDLPKGGRHVALQ